MFIFQNYKWPTTVAGLLACLCMSGCVQPMLISSSSVSSLLPKLPKESLDDVAPLTDPVGHDSPDAKQPIAPLRYPEQLRSRVTLAQFSDLELPDVLPPEPTPLSDLEPPYLELPAETQSPVSDEPTLEPNALNSVRDEVIQRGRTAFNESCTQCHEASQALIEKKTYEEWVDTVTEMSDLDDAEIKDSQIIPIATYLASRSDEEIAASQAEAESESEDASADEDASSDQVEDKANENANDKKEPEVGSNDGEEDYSEQIEFGEVAFNASCVDCHDAARSLKVKKSYAKWMATIRRMAKKEDAEIDSRDFSPIARYLANRTDAEIEAAKREADEERENDDEEDESDQPDDDSKDSDNQDKRTLISQGKTAFYNSCVECHDAERSLSAEKSFSEWMSTIRRMAEKEDASINSSDFRPIATFLSERTADEIEKSKEDADAKKEEGSADESSADGKSDAGRKFDPQVVAAGRVAFNKSCLKCHDAQRSLSKKKSLASWRATVKRMAAKDGADVRPSDIEPISVYLASESASGEGAGDESAAEVNPWTFSSTLSTLHRASSDPIENPGFFVDAWVGADWQSDGPLRATVMACTSCHSDRNSSKGFTFELVEASATLDLKKLLFNKYHSRETKRAASQGMPSGSHRNSALALNAPQNAESENGSSGASDDSPISTSADLKMGRFIVPFGAYAAFSHPGSYRTITNPLMFNMGRRLDTGGPFQPVLPGPYSDEGLNLRLALREYCDRSYTLDLFAVNGLQGTASGTNFNLSRSYTDNNGTPAVGGRYTLGNQIFRLGASAMLGDLQNEGSEELDYHLIGADALVNTERFRAYFEYAFRREQAGATNNNEIDGYVIELEWKVRERLGFLTRYDTLEHEVASAGEQSIDRFTWGLNLALEQAGLLLLNHEHWMLDDRSDVDVVGLRWITTF